MLGVELVRIAKEMSGRIGASNQRQLQVSIG